MYKGRRHLCGHGFELNKTFFYSCVFVLGSREVTNHLSQFLGSCFYLASRTIQILETSRDFGVSVRRKEMNRLSATFVLHIHLSFGKHFELFQLDLVMTFNMY